MTTTKSPDSYINRVAALESSDGTRKAVYFTLSPPNSATTFHRVFHDYALSESTPIRFDSYDEMMNDAANLQRFDLTMTFVMGGLVKEVC